jgi:glycosyltransferase involved in cell wall biosynthesis
MTPRVSILVPVHNAREWIAAAIESALAQTWDNTEVIVLDDGSTDSSAEAVRACAPNIRIEIQQRRGQNASRNRLTALSSGEWLLYLDADDELAPDAVERKMARTSGADALYGSMELRTQRGRELISSQMIVATSFDDPLAAAFLWKYPNTSSFMFRRQAVIDAGGWNEAIHSCTDYDLYFKLLLSGKHLRPVPDSFSVYRHWDGARASTENAMRSTTTRLEMMWRAADTLTQSQRWTRDARAAFSAATLGVIRVIYGLDPSRAVAEHERLRAWNPRVGPAPPFFSAGYRAAYRLLGFRWAERVAGATRTMKQLPLPADR